MTTDMLGRVSVRLAEVATMQVRSRRQREVAELLAAGRSQRQVAEALGITRDSVRVHVAKLRGKRRRR